MRHGGNCSSFDRASGAGAMGQLAFHQSPRPGKDPPRDLGTPVG
jgi:hypothetical protein